MAGPCRGSRWEGEGRWAVEAGGERDVCGIELGVVKFWRHSRKGERMWLSVYHEELDRRGKRWHTDEGMGGGRLDGRKGR
jgi:hypothetical protein